MRKSRQAIAEIGRFDFLKSAPFVHANLALEERMHLRCNNRHCAHTLDLHERAVACPKCGDLLEVVVDAPKVAPDDLKRMWRERRMSNAGADTSGVWRFRDLLPGPYDPASLVTLSEGNTPLVHGQKTGKAAGLRPSLLQASRMESHRDASKISA